MKTFDEAMEMLQVESLNTAELYEKIQKAKTDCARYAAICEEIRTSEKAHAYIDGMLLHKKQLKLKKKAFALSCFINGVMLGLEMNAQDAPIRTPDTDPLK